PPRFPELLKKTQKQAVIVNNTPVTPAPKTQVKTPVKRHVTAKRPVSQLQEIPPIQSVLIEARNIPENFTTLKEPSVQPPSMKDAKGDKKKSLRGRISEWFNKIKEHFSGHKFHGGGKRHGKERF